VTYLLGWLAIRGYLRRRDEGNDLQSLIALAAEPADQAPEKAVVVGNT
jgi:hypothetical protein